MTGSGLPPPYLRRGIFGGVGSAIRRRSVHVVDTSHIPSQPSLLSSRWRFPRRCEVDFAFIVPDRPTRPSPRARFRPGSGRPTDPLRACRRGYWGVGGGRPTDRPREAVGGDAGSTVRVGGDTGRFTSAHQRINTYTRCFESARALSTVFARCSRLCRALDVHQMLHADGAPGTSIKHLEKTLFFESRPVSTTSYA